jgi:hypothetical protein
MTKLLSYLSAGLLFSTHVAFSQSAPAKDQTNPQPSVTRTHLDSQFGKLPLSFEPNRGQADSHVQWVARGPQYALFLTGHDAVLEMNKVTPLDKKTLTGMPSITSSAVRMNLLGAVAASVSTGERALSGTANYMTGKDSSKWQTNVPTYGKVRLAQVYPGIDLVYYGTQGRLEYDFLVAPNTDPSTIRLSFDGAQPRLASNGDLVLTVNGSKEEVRFDKPVVYQMKDGIRQPVEGSFTIAENQQVSFTLGSYDATRELVIDPTLIFLGILGTGSVGTVPNGMTVDSSGEMIITGYTGDLDFPVTGGALQTNCQNYSTGAATAGFKRCGPGATTSAFVTKISADGTSLVYSTYLHGLSGAESAQSVAADTAGNAYVLGITDSSDFPITGDAFQSLCQPYYPNRGVYSGSPSDYYPEISACNGGPAGSYSDALATLFVVKLNPTGSAILYGTFFGGTAAVYPVQIALDSSNNIYFAGYLSGATTAANYYPNSTNVPFPVSAGAYQQYGIGVQAPTLSELSADGHTLLYSTLIGSQNTTAFFPSSEPYALAVGPNGIAYLGGQTLASDFPTTPGVVRPNCALSSGNAGDCANYTAFLSAFDTTKSGSASLLYSTYIGGTEVATAGNSTPQQVQGLAADSSNNVYVTGYSTAIDFPTTKGAYQTTCIVFSNSGTCNPNAFITKINPTGTAYVWSTLYGGDNNSSQWANGEAVALDAKGRVYLYGQSRFGGGDFINPIEPYYGGDKLFVATFSADGSQLLFGTHVGNASPTESENDEPIPSSGLFVDATGNMYVVGYAADNGALVGTSGTYASTAAGGGYRAFFGKISPVLTQSSTALTVAPTTTTTNQSVTFTAVVTSPAQTTPVPTGTVVFTNPNTTPATQIGTGNIDATGTAVFSTSSLTAATYSVIATYSGDTEYDASSSSPTTLTIKAPVTANVTLSITPSKGAVGTSITFSTTVTGTGGTPTGTVYFFDGTTILGSAVLANGATSYSTIALAAGTHSISVQYTGDNVFGSATSAAQNVTLTASASAATVTTLTSSSASASQGTRVTFTATISSTVTGIPTGSVIFYDGTTNLGTGTLTNAAATFTTSTLAVGSHSITAAYSGDSVFLPSTSSIFTQTIVASSFTMAASPASLTIQPGVSGTTVITITPTGAFAGTLTLACGALPTDGSCAFAPATLTFAASSTAAQSSTLTFSTLAPTTAERHNLRGLPFAPQILAALLLLPLGLTRRLLRSAKKGGSWPRSMLFLAIAVIGTSALFGLSGCGGGSKTPTSTSGANTTPAGTYIVPVIASNASTSMTINLQFTVQ